MSRVVGEQPWTEVDKSQSTNSSWSTGSTAFHGFLSLGFPSTSAFSSVSAKLFPFITWKSYSSPSPSNPDPWAVSLRPPCPPASCQPFALVSGVASSLRVSAPGFAVASQAHTLGLTSWVCTLLPFSADSLTAVFLAGPVHAALCLPGPLTWPQLSAWTFPPAPPEGPSSHHWSFLHCPFQRASLSPPSQ